MKKFLALLIIAFIPISVFAKGITGDISGLVTKVTDGDTIKVVDSAFGVEYTIRILGLDTPEKSKTRFGYAECYGSEASDYVSKILQTSGSLAYAELYSTDKYQRDLADVYIGTYTGELLAENIIRNGYGWVYRTGVKTKNYSKLLRAERLAQKEKRGLWNDGTCGGQRISLEKLEQSRKIEQDRLNQLSKKEKERQEEEQKKQFEYQTRLLEHFKEYPMDAMNCVFCG